MQIGYDPNFIGDGIRIPLPEFKNSLDPSVLRKPGVLRNDLYSDHLHFTLVMNKHTRQLVYSAHNIDQSKFREKVPGKGKRGWSTDDDIGAANQLDNRYYKDRSGPSGAKIPNPYDRGHMVMRFNNMWGDTDAESDKAGKATFIYANASLQHENLNRDEWRALELVVVREFQHDDNGKLSIFTGPIFGDLDRHINLSPQDSARVPSGFFKVLCYRTQHSRSPDRLGVLAFAIFQDSAVLRDKKGSATVKTNRNYQVTITELQNLTGIDFGRELRKRNPLFYRDLAERNSARNVPTVPERIPVGRGVTVIGEPETRRDDIEHLATRRVIINSAMIDPTGNERRREWISLHNRGDRKTQIAGWTLEDGAGRRATLVGSIDTRW